MNTKIWKSLLTAGMAISLAACGSTSTAASGSASASTSAEAKTILIGISPDYPPFDDLTTDGQLTGFDYDMGEWLFTWLNENGYNYKHEWKQMSFDTIISSIQTDQIDLGISGFTYAVRFSSPIHIMSPLRLRSFPKTVRSLRRMSLLESHLAASLALPARPLPKKYPQTTQPLLKTWGLRSKH